MDDIGGILKMRWLALALALFMILVPGMSQGFPLHASNGAVNCTIFGAFKDPWSTGYPNANSYAVLMVDLSLTRANASDKTPIQATYSLKDGNDRVYMMGPEYKKDLQLGRWLIGFVVPRETIAKSLMVGLSQDPAGGDSFPISFPELSNSSNDNVTLLYYGVLRSFVEANRKTIVLDVAVTNNDTTKLTLSSENFSLLDQWGWKYDSKEYDIYGKKGISAMKLEPNQTQRSGLVFSPISPKSRPAELVYNYSNSSSIRLDIDSEAGSRSNIASQESCNECDTPKDEPAPNSLAGSIKASKARLAKVKGNITDSSPPKGRDEL
jgi:hypothetical protein